MSSVSVLPGGKRGSTTVALRKKFVEQALSYVGVPYAQRFHGRDSCAFCEHHHAPLFLDCCGLVRQCLKDLAPEFGFEIGRWNQSYQFDLLPNRVGTPEELLPGDLVFYSGEYYDQRKKRRIHDMVHVEIYYGRGRTIGARFSHSTVQIWDSYKFTSKNYHNVRHFFSSIDTWLAGVCQSHCPTHAWFRPFGEIYPYASPVLRAIRTPRGRSAQEEGIEKGRQQQQQQEKSVAAHASSSKRRSKSRSKKKVHRQGGGGRAQSGSPARQRGQKRRPRSASVQPGVASSTSSSRTGSSLPRTPEAAGPRREEQEVRRPSTSPERCHPGQQRVLSLLLGGGHGGARATGLLLQQGFLPRSGWEKDIWRDELDRMQRFFGGDTASSLVRHRCGGGEGLTHPDVPQEQKHRPRERRHSLFRSRVQQQQQPQQQHQGQEEAAAGRGSPDVLDLFSQCASVVPATATTQQQPEDESSSSSLWSYGSSQSSLPSCLESAAQSHPNKMGARSFQRAMRGFHLAAERDGLVVDRRPVPREEEEQQEEWVLQNLDSCRTEEDETGGAQRLDMGDRHAVHAMRRAIARRRLQGATRDLPRRSRRRTLLKPPVPEYHPLPVPSQLPAPAPPFQPYREVLTLPRKSLKQQQRLAEEHLRRRQESWDNRFHL